MRLMTYIFIFLAMSCGPDPLKPIAATPGGPGSENGGPNSPGNGNNTPEEPGPGNEEPPPPSRILYVNGSIAEGGDGSLSAPFKSIQSALNSAPEDAEIRIAAGEYYEHLQITKSMTLTGGYSGANFESRNEVELTTILRDTRTVGGESLIQPVAALTIKTGNSPVFVKNMEIIGADVDQDTTIVSQYDEVAVAVAVMDSKKVTIENSKMVGGKTGQYTVGLLASQSSINVMKNTIEGGAGYNSYGLYFTGDTSAKVTDNRVNGGSGAAGSSAVLAYESGSSLYARNRVFAGAGLQNCYGMRVSTPTTGLKSFYNNVVDRSECTGSLVGFETWGNSLRNGSVVIRNNTISTQDNSSSNQNVTLKLTSLYNANVEVTNNIFETDRRTTQSTCVSESDVNAHPRLFRYNNFADCNFLYYRFTASGGRNINTITELEVNPENNIFGNLTVAMTFIQDMKPAGGTDQRILQGGVNGSVEEWPDVADFAGKGRTGLSNGLGWSMGAYEFEN